MRKLSIHPNCFVILDYQLAIIDECEKAENAGHEMNVEKMWDLLLAGEEEARLATGVHWQAIICVSLEKIQKCRLRSMALIAM